MKTITIYTDGACSGNPGPGGWGAILQYGPHTRELSGGEPKVEAIHAGLECGLFAGKLEGLDAVSIGPDMRDIHSPREKLSVSSVGRTWAYLTAVLARL